jgi:DNA-binding transcriptional MocR family regulator
MNWTSQVWTEFRARRLTPFGRDVLLRLASFRGRKGLIFPSHQALADRARCSVRTVKRALDAGAALGLVRWIERRIKVGHWATERTSNLYELIAKSADKCSNGQSGRVASPEAIPFFLAAVEDPNAARAQAELAKIRVDRDRKIAHEWAARRSRGQGGLEHGI